MIPVKGDLGHDMWQASVYLLRANEASSYDLEVGGRPGGCHPTPSKLDGWMGTNPPVRWKPCWHVVIEGRESCAENIVIEITPSVSTILID
jgi:hypothetical protein